MLERTPCADFYSVFLLWHDALFVLLSFYDIVRLLLRLVSQGVNAVGSGGLRVLV